MQEKCQNCFQSVTTPPERADNENGSLHCVAFEDIAKERKMCFLIKYLDGKIKPCTFASNKRKMKKDSVLRRLNSLKSQLSSVGVTQIGLFGSTVRNENSPASDIDILLDFDAGQETYLNFLIACQILEDNFRRDKLDVVTRKGLSPYIGQSILKEVEYV
jgi:Predicted nucleotidyltransferases